jgi:hypothetical protein
MGGERVNPLDDDAPDTGAQPDPDAASVEERAANGEHLESSEPAPMRGDSQLRLDVGKLLDPASRKVLEATISLSAAEVPVDGLFKPEQRYPFVAMGVPGNVTDHFVRDPKSNALPKRVMGVKKRQNVTVDAVRRADDPEVIRELFGMLDVESKARLLDQLREDVSATLQAA